MSLVGRIGDLTHRIGVELKRSKANRGLNLVTNGSGALGDAYNFPGMTFVSTDAPTGARGSFEATGTGVTYWSEESYAVDPSRAYLVEATVKQANGTGALYVGLAPYDAYDLAIHPYMYMARPGSETALSRPLNPGDTQIKVYSTAGWNNSAGGNIHLRSIIFWDYVDPGGKHWGNQYSRNWLNNAYADGGIADGTTINLSTPYDGPTKPTDTIIANGSSGGNYLYVAASNVFPNSVWRRYVGQTKPGVHPSGTLLNASDRLPVMAARVKMLFLPNYAPANNGFDGKAPRQRFAHIGLREIPAQGVRPVGEITMWYGPKTQCPDGWLVCDGASFSASEYPALAALIPSWTLPNFTDRSPIGAGVKAVGSLDGSASKVLAAGNLPQHGHAFSASTSADAHSHTFSATTSVNSHSHEITRKSGTGSSTGMAQGSSNNAANANSLADSHSHTVSGTTAGDTHSHSVSGTTGGGPGSAAPFDIMGPTVATWFIIRASET